MMKKTIPALSLLLLMDFTASRGVASATDCLGDITDGNGGRIGYHSPSPTDTYMPDCQNPLQRELWRVFEQQDGTSYIIPRPDGLGTKYNLCPFSAEDDNTSTGAPPPPPLVESELSDKVQQYGLCDELVTDPLILNSMDTMDALLIVNAFHRQLRFRVVNRESGEPYLDPWAPDNDILDACDYLSSNNDGEDYAAAESYCSSVANRCNGEGVCIEIGIIPSLEAIDVIVPALNEIYGIGDVGDECLPEEWGTTFQCPVAGCLEAPLGCEYITDHTVINTIRDCCPELCYAVDSDGNQCSTKVANSSSSAANPKRSSSSLIFFGGTMVLLVKSLFLGIDRIL